jgi:hypothetical protein
MKSRRPLTAAQLEARDARRAQFRELAQRLAALSDDQRAALAERMLVHTVEGRPLSLHNVCLLAMQQPRATLVGGFNQWRAQGRTVRKGEHGLMIWAPTKATIEPTATPVETGDGADPLKFITVTVFDVSQTDAISA